MKNLSQNIIEFDHDKNFRNEDFYISKSNKHVIDLLNEWPNWEKNFINIIGKDFQVKHI